MMDKFDRFPTISVNVEPRIGTYLKALNGYFDSSRKPYWGWFNWYNQVLQGFGTSYAKGAIHTDLFSPLGTIRGWSSLSKKEP
jgi:hypothetical protein